MHRIVDGKRVPLSEKEIEEIKKDEAARKKKLAKRAAEIKEKKEAPIRALIREEILKMKEEGLI